MLDCTISAALRTRVLHHKFSAWITAVMVKKLFAYHVTVTKVSITCGYGNQFIFRIPHTLYQLCINFIQFPTHKLMTGFCLVFKLILLLLINCSTVTMLFRIVTVCTVTVHCAVQLQYCIYSCRL